ncbi:uncharacterized protein TNCV_869911 [Trichonephila clavipes]|nr:uncharacterized protein TNCV_869911 [Trichonephila clavipes]
MPFFDIRTCQESKVWVFEDDLTPLLVKRQRAMKKVKYAEFFRNTGLVKVIQLEGQKIETANWYTTKCFPEVLQKVNVTIGIAFQASITAEVSACSEEGRFEWLRNLRSNSSQRCSTGFRSGL